MKKQNLNLLLAASAILTGVIAYSVVKLTTSPIMQFMPLLLYAISLLLLLSRPIKLHYHRRSSLFGALLITWLLAMGSMFLLFYIFPTEGVLSKQWTASETTMLASVQIAFALGAAFITGSIIYSTLRDKNNELRKIEA